MPNRLAKHFASFADLAAAYVQDKDYRIVVVPRSESSTAVVAPHGGGIEAFTADIARGIAGEDYGLYLFEGLLRAGNFAALHLSSERFDEPECLRMLQHSDRVISVHGCGAPGKVVMVGGLDEALRDAVIAQLRAVGIDCEDAPARLAGAQPRNICNRGRTGRGVQLEVSLDLRRSRQRTTLISAVRRALEG